MRILNFIKGKAAKAKAAVIGFFRNTAKNIREDFTPATALTTAQRDARRIRAVLQPASGRRVTAGFTLASMMMSLFGVTAFAEAASSSGEGVALGVSKSGQWARQAVGA